MDVAWGLAAVFFLIFANAFFVAGEFALVAVDRERIQRLASEGHPGARSTLKGLRTLSFQLSGAQLGITISSLVLGFILEATIADPIGALLQVFGLPAATSVGVAVAIGLVLATATQMILGELVPKNLAIAKPLPVAFAIVGPMRAVNTAFKPLIVFLNAAANRTVRLLGIEPQEELIPVRSIEELELLIESSREGGVLPEDEYSLLARSISFGDKTAADALTPRVAVEGVERDTSIGDVVAKALETGHSRFPVYRETLDDIVGVVHVKDIYRVPADQRDRATATRIAREPFVVPESRPLTSLMADMKRQRAQLAIVLDEFGGTAGIITNEDLLEEIVGEIEDEYDRAEDIQQETGVEGVHLLAGTLHLDEVKDACGLELPEGDYETLAGFLLSRFERIPAAGDQTAYAAWELKVVEMDGRRIATVLAVHTPSRTEATDEDTR